jgi:hypothetical protein
VEWAAPLDDGAQIGLQVGRIEPEWQKWNVAPVPGERWTTEFDLPVNSNFVAFRGSRELERAIGRVTITPISVFDESARPRVPIVLATRQYPEATVFFHDERAMPEPTGFWVLGGQQSTITVARERTDAPFAVLVHSGAEPNIVTFRMRGWERVVSLEPGEPQVIELPDSMRRVLTFTIRADDGFRPDQYDPTSRDTRYLGAWIQVTSAQPTTNE